jgi:hypothetical protein
MLYDITPELLPPKPPRTIFDLTGFIPILDWRLIPPE